MNEDRIGFQEATAYLMSGPMGEGRFDASQPMPVEVEAAINLLVERAIRARVAGNAELRCISNSYGSNGWFATSSADGDPGWRKI